MFNILDAWKNFKTRQNEKMKAQWLKFKSQRSEKTQQKLDDFEKKYKIYKESALCEIIETVVFVIVAVIIIRFFLWEIRWIPSGSMKPTLIEGDRIVVERFSRFYSTPKRGDIMVFYPPATKLSRKPLPLLSRLIGIKCKDIAYIKRVVGMPGDKLEIKFEEDGSAYVYINDEKFEEPYIKSIYEYKRCNIDNLQNLFLPPDSIIKCGPFQIPEGHYFMMGDNRGDSCDSRYWGTITADRFVGRAVSIFWPIKRARTIPHIKTIDD